MKKEYDLAGEVIGAAMKVHAALGKGFLESVYQKALVLELEKGSFLVETEKEITVYYEKQEVGIFVADLLVNNQLIAEIQAVQELAKAHETQLVNYLVATGIDEGVLLNFGAESLQFKEKFRVAKKKKG